MISRKQDALWAQGQRATAAGRWAEAVAAYESIVQYDPSFVPAWLELCSAKEQLDDYRGAHDAVLGASRVGGIPPIAALAVARRLRQFEEIELTLRYVHANGLAGRVPAERLVDLISFFASAGLHDMSMPWIQRLLTLQPRSPEAHNMHGVVLMFAGRLSESAEAFKLALRLNPKYTNAYAMLSRVRKATNEDNCIDSLCALLAGSGLSRKDETNLCLALHNELHELGEFERSWGALSRMCELRSVDQPYDRSRSFQVLQSMRAAYGTPFMESENTHPDTKPIFIVGLHRSGTTLLERMLSGHPSVADAGETYTFTAALRHETNHFCRQAIDPVMASRLPNIDHERVGVRFMRGMAVRSAGKPFITEKLNPNFMLLGPIAAALPHARILHMERDAIDTCFSNLRTLFTHEAPYSYRQEDMAHFYSVYREFMRHWNAVLPDRVLNVRYQSLVDSPAQASSQVAAHCGFDFVDDMLQVGREGGHVATASSGQVRDGIVRTRQGLWRAYERQLQPMIDLLAKDGHV